MTIIECTPAELLTNSGLLRTWADECGISSLPELAEAISPYIKDGAKVIVFGMQPSDEPVSVALDRYIEFNGL